MNSIRRGSGRPIRHLGSSRGDGRLLVEGGAAGAVSYEIDRYSDHRGETGNGRLSADAALLAAAFDAGKAALILADGSRNEVVLLEAGADGSAEFSVREPVAA